MPRRAIDPLNNVGLRTRAYAKLTGRASAEGAQSSASAALGVLHELASSPETAPDALALLHELQVHQVELELQDEELRSSRGELEAALARQIQLYDFASVGLFTVDLGTVMHELNLTGARLLELERNALIGQPLEAFLTPDSARALSAVLARVKASGEAAGCTLELAEQGPRGRAIHASVSADPADGNFLIALTEIHPNRETPTR